MSVFKNLHATVVTDLNLIFISWFQDGKKKI